MNLSKKEVVVITGATAGVGRATAREFARLGHPIGLLARDEGRLKATKEEIERRGGRAHAVSTDVADAARVERAAVEIEEELGTIGIWVNNAMSTVFARTVDVTPDEYRRATEVTYLGTVHGTMAALKRMWPRNHGCIVQVGSALAYRAIPLQAAYCGAKHAIRGFTDSLRTELLHENKNISISMVQLPAMNTPQFAWCRSKLPKHPQPVSPIFQPEVAARGIVQAVLTGRREILVGGPTMRAIWGNTCAPGFADQYLAEHGYESQQTDEPMSSQREGNLFKPVPGDYAAHGSFDDRSLDSAWEFPPRHRAISIAAAGAAGVICGLFLGR